MKKKLFYCLFAAFCAVAILPSCNDDDGPGADYSQAIEEEIAGEYKGTLSVTVAGAAAPVTNQNITVSKASSTAINLTISNFSFSGMSLGDVVLENCELQQSGDTYTCQREEELTLPDPVGTCTVASEITIAGGQVTVTLDITVPALNDQVVTVVYEGTKLTGTEETGAEILSFTFDTTNEANSCVIEQPVIGEDNTITFRVDADAVAANADLLTTLVPTITVSDGATLSPASGVATDFSSNVTYTVLSEDGKTTTTYTVSAPYQNSQMKYSFDEWEDMSGTFNFIVNTTQYTWSSPMPHTELASANEGVAALRESFGGGYTGEWAMTREENGYVGSAVKLQTLYTNDLNEMVSGSIPAITSASLYTGTFEFSMQTVAEKQLEMTKFGWAYEKKPVKFKGAYKYAKGDNYIDGSQEPALENQDGEDRGLIIAVLYEVESDDETLDGTNLLNSSKRVMIAQVGGEEGVGDTQEWTEFDVDFTTVDGKEYDANKNYKLAIVCQSSINGGQFKGAANSTLWVDELEVIGE